MLDLVLVLVGIGLLTAGGEALIRGALGAANRLGMSPLLSGLLIVGFGTSMPELVVSLDAAIHQLPDLAIGNVVGSNIANILLILGLCALLTPMAVKPLALSRDSVVMVAATVLFLWIARDGLLGGAAGVLFLGGCWSTWSGPTAAKSSTARRAARSMRPKPASLRRCLARPC
jgi:cation:H+ antiporter